MVTCPRCGEDEKLERVRQLGGTARIIACLTCGNEWQIGDLPTQVEPGKTTAERLKAKFPTASDIKPSTLRILDQLASSFDSTVPDEERAFVAQYQAAFSQDRLPQLSANEFK